MWHKLATGRFFLEESGHFVKCCNTFRERNGDYVEKCDSFVTAINKQYQIKYKALI